MGSMACPGRSHAITHGIWVSAETSRISPSAPMSELCEGNLLIDDGFRIAAAVHEVGEVHAGDGHLA
jgi:hypothetical protein